jgi:Chitobiase/beta-hexosaminidase C-terminal domain
MAVISISVTESGNEIIAGIPFNVSLQTNIPATIFYTLDGTTPTTLSLIYMAPIQIPQGATTVVLSYFATNGTDSSSVIIQTYQTDVLGQNARTPYSGTNAPPGSSQATFDPAPFGTPPIAPNQKFLGAGAAGLTVYNEALPPGDPTGYNADGYPTGFTNNQEKALPTKQFPFLFVTSDNEGMQGYGIGNLPPHTVVHPKPPPEQSEYGSQFFDPRAFVIVQDLTKPQDPNIPPLINSPNFTLENVNRTREGNQYFNVGEQTPPTTGTFVSRQFNASNNTMTYYYFDSQQLRWLISTMPYTPAPDQFNYGRVHIGGFAGAGSRNVYAWFWNKGDYLH